AGTLVFMGSPRTKALKEAHDCGVLMRGPMMATALACLFIGLAPALCWPAISRAISSWHPVWVDTAPPSSLFVLGSCHLVLALVGAAAGFCLWRIARFNGLRRGLTWDCGYVRPTARMQYTSGSFASIAAGWFCWLLQPERRVR